MFNAGNHEIHERLWGVNDAMRVGHLDAKALEELYRVEERLFLVKISDGGGSFFDCSVEMLQALAEIITTERTGIEGGNYRFDFVRDDVALDKIGHSENLPKNAFGEDVLDDHLLDGFD
jgi:hypothetical protein